MSAATELPRGTVITPTAFSGTPTVPIVLAPAVSGIQHVLTNFTMDTATSPASAATQNPISLTVGDGVTDIVFAWGEGTLAAATVGTPFEWSGQFITGVGNALEIVSFSPVTLVANLFLSVIANFYDI